MENKNSTALFSRKEKRMFLEITFVVVISILVSFLACLLLNTLGEGNKTHLLTYLFIPIISAGIKQEIFGLDKPTLLVCGTGYLIGGIIWICFIMTAGECHVNHLLSSF